MKTRNESGVQFIHMSIAAIAVAGMGVALLMLKHFWMARQMSADKLTYAEPRSATHGEKPR